MSIHIEVKIVIGKKLTYWLSQDDFLLIQSSDQLILETLLKNKYKLCLSNSVSGEMNVATIAMPTEGKANPAEYCFGSEY